MRKGPWLMAVMAAWSLWLLLAVVSGTKAPSTPYMEVLALLVFKGGLTNSSALFSWNQLDPTPCQWSGVVCDSLSQTVWELRLDGMSLSGPIGQTLADLTDLRALSLSRNNFSGRFPDAVARIPSLRSVNLSGNALSGPVPAVFGNGSLEEIDLSFNSFSGALPPEIFSTNKESLSFVSVASNEVLGSIPPEFYDCAVLAHFNFSGNKLAGNLSGDVGRLVQLQVADASYNGLSGAIPETISSLVNLRELRLTANALNGPLPDGLGSVVKLEVLDAGFNTLGGSLPDFRALSMLRVLNLRGNRLGGSIPLWIGSLTSLTTLDLGGNIFSGPIPSGLGLLHSLQMLFLFDNGLTGSLPTALGSLAVSNADLSLNRFTGPIPSDLITTNLRMLNLSNNLLSRTTSLGNCESLQALDLSQNYLTGGLPTDIGNCIALLSVDVSDNSLSSVIPLEIGNLVLLQYLDLSNNSFNGSIPDTLGRNTQLLGLYLDDNDLSGPIPVELGDCGLLEELDLSVNNLSGTIPAEMGNLSRLQWLDVSYNSLSGAIPAELGQLPNLGMLNVSNNRLQGRVPEGGVFGSAGNTTTVYAGNAGLCGTAINVSCDAAAGNSNGTTESVVRLRTRAISVSALVAICVAAAVALGVVVVTLCNIHAHQKRNRAARGSVLTLDSATESGSPDLALGKLVMFPRKGEARTEGWLSAVRGLINKDCEIGRGAFGTVYRAVLPDGQPVAVKKLVVAGLVKSQEEFEREVQALGKVRHQHVVALQGYYWSKQVQLLIYDYVGGGNLYSRLHERGAGEPVLDWPSRFRIAMGTALGLAHLHHSQRPSPIIHYDIKSTNILLGERDEPRISDSGLAKLLPVLDTFVMSSKFQSALGYMAPEFACQNVRINEKCDVYGFGVLLLELVTGRRPVEYAEDDVVVLAESMRSLLEEGTPLVAVDPELYYYAEDEVLPLIKLGLICTSQIASHRPSMAEVIQILELVKPLVEDDKSSSC